MKQLLVGFLVLGLTTAAWAGEGYVQTGKHGIMHFVQVDKDKATDIATYRRAVDDLCKPDSACQVLFWTENAPVKMPFSHQQTKGKTAYWQYHKKSDSYRLYVDCELFGEIEDAECL